MCECNVWAENRGGREYMGEVGGRNTHNTHKPTPTHKGETPCHTRAEWVICRARGQWWVGEGARGQRWVGARRVQGNESMRGHVWKWKHTQHMLVPTTSSICDDSKGRIVLTPHCALQREKWRTSELQTVLM